VLRAGKTIDQGVHYNGMPAWTCERRCRKKKMDHELPGDLLVWSGSLFFWAAHRSAASACPI